jgi:hypothetical protein
MDIFDEEILKFWAALQKCQVRYIMVGGYASNLHGYHEPVARISDKTIERLLLREFGDHASEVKEKFLHVKSDTPRGKNRISAAIVKLSNGDLDKIDHYIDLCNLDFRDVVAPAEYPRYTTVAFNEIPRWKKGQFYLADWKEYSSWLRK